MEGDPLEDGGLEYLFGVWYRDGGTWSFQPFWAHDRAEERRAFEAFMDFVAARRERSRRARLPLRQLRGDGAQAAGQLHATREVEVDNLLRQGALVDLYKVVREALRISEPSYSIKYVEHFYRAAREGDVQSAGASIVFYERWRETQDAQLLQDIADYNRDDVESTAALRDWLLTLRPAGLPWKTAVAEAAADGAEPAPSSKAQRAERGWCRTGSDSSMRCPPIAAHGPPSIACRS